MPSNLDELRGEYSYGAVIGGKGLIKLGHMTADGRRLVHQVNLKTRRGKVKRGLHTTDPSADNHYVSKFTPRETLTEAAQSVLFPTFYVLLRCPVCLNDFLENLRDILNLYDRTIFQA